MATTTNKYIYTSLLKRAAQQRIFPNKTQDARDWFRNKALNYRPSKYKLFKDATLTSIPLPGRMYMYTYDAKTKDTLPYWDAFPLIFHVKSETDGFYGINMHYLSPVLRARLMDALYTIVNNTRYNNSTKLNISYSVLKNASTMRYFKPCFKKYLFSHVRSQMIYVEPKEWDIALFLPLQKFQKASDETVWRDSSKAANEGSVKVKRTKRGKR